MMEKNIAVEEVQDSGCECHEYRNNNDIIPILKNQYSVLWNNEKY